MHYFSVRADMERFHSDILQKIVLRKLLSCTVKHSKNKRCAGTDILFPTPLEVPKSTLLTPYKLQMCSLHSPQTSSGHFFSPWLMCCIVFLSVILHNLSKESLGSRRLHIHSMQFSKAHNLVRSKIISLYNKGNMPNFNF